MEYCIEIRQHGTSIVPGEYKVVALGGISEMRALFPVVVNQAMERGYESVIIFNQEWEPQAQWSWKGVDLPLQVEA